MKIKISEMGVLELERKANFKIQSCPYGSGGEYCGDWCPMFGEPEPYVDIVTVYEGGVAKSNKLSLCHAELIGDVEDLR